MKLSCDYHTILYMICDIVSNHTIVPNIQDNEPWLSTFGLIKVMPHKSEACLVSASSEIYDNLCIFVCRLQ